MLARRIMVRLLSRMGFLVLAGCAGDVSFVAKEPDPAISFSLIEVVPQVIDFGELTSVEVGRETITVRNNGIAVLSVDRVTLDGPGEFEMVLPSEPPWLIEPQGSLTFEATYRPAAGGEAEARITLEHTAQNSDPVPVDLFGAGAFPSLHITPDPMRFGDRFVPCPTTRSFFLSNVGIETLEITDIRLEGEADQIDFAFDPPQGLRLIAEQLFELPVVFDPQFPQDWGAELVVESNDPASPARVPIEGNARYVTQTTEQFVVPDVQPVNILFAVDQSCSMDDEQTLLANQFSQFVGVLNNANVDWKVAVYTGSNPECFQRGILTPNTPNWAAQFTAAVSEGGGGVPYNGGNDLSEAHLEGVQRAIARDAPGQCNYGFRDAGAPLHMIMISDERDQSTGYNGASTYWNQYLTSYRTYAGTGPLTVHGVLDVAQQCGNTPMGADGYLPVISATGGQLLNVCTTSWANQLASIAQDAVNDLAFYPLSGTALDPSTITVQVNGVDQPTGWSWDGGRRGIVFDPLPPPGAVIDVTYGVLVNCTP